jgi:hypothetical protein
MKSLFLFSLLQIISALGILVLFLHKFFKKNIHIKNEKYFIDKIDELTGTRQYASVIAMLDENFDSILNRVSKKEFSVKVEGRLKDYRLINYIVKLKPYFGLKIISNEKTDIYFKRMFANGYIRALLKNEDSVLYKEIQNNQNLSSTNRYILPESNAILHKLFKDITTAKNIEVWRPIGETVNDILDEQYHKQVDIYNEYDGKIIYDYEEQFRNPIFVGIIFFDIMITEAIYQKINWHMRLYYYSYFVEKICRNYKVSEYRQEDNEYPDIYSGILYEIISNLRGWINIIEYDTEEVQQEIKYIDYNHENGNIIKSSVICLSQCIKKILCTEAISDKFKEYLTHIIINLYFNLALSTQEVSRRYGEVMIACIIHDIKGYGMRSENYKYNLMTYLDTFDTTHITNKDKLKELKSRLTEA